MDAHFEIQAYPSGSVRIPKKRKRVGDESPEYSGSSSSSDEDEETNVGLKRNFEQHTSDEEGKLKLN